MPVPQKIIDYIEQNEDNFIARLGKAVAIPSVSGDKNHRDDVISMAKCFLKKELEAIGVKVEFRDIGKQIIDGEEIPLPPVIFGSITDDQDKNKKTVLLYNHYDVQPALKSDGWNTEPFILDINKNTGRLTGRGSTDDKGPLLGWINCIEAHYKLGLKLPVNIKMCFEGMEENGSVNLQKLIKDESGPGKFFDGVDCVCISDNYWLTTRTPCLTYGLRGIVYYRIKISGPGHNLHSGEFGGTVYEPMTDLAHIMSKLVTPDGKILIPGINEMVEELTDGEKALYEKMDYSIEDLESAAGGKVAIASNKVDALMHRMRYPSLSFHGIVGASSGPEAETVIPASIIGKFSIRLVPKQTPEKVKTIVTEYIKKVFCDLKSKNTLVVDPLQEDGTPWSTSTEHWNYRAGIKATEIVYNGQTPDLTREGGSIPVVLTFADLGKGDVSVLLLPMGRGDDGAHSINEKLDISNFMNGTKLMATYLYEVATTN